MEVPRFIACALAGALAAGAGAVPASAQQRGCTEMALPDHGMAVRVPHPAGHVYVPLAAALAPAPCASLKVETGACLCRVLVDGQDAGVVGSPPRATHVLQLLPGRHRIEIRRAASTVLSADVEVEPAREYAIRWPVEGGCGAAGGDEGRGGYRVVPGP